MAGSQGGWPLAEIQQIADGKVDGAETVFRLLRKGVLSSPPAQLQDRACDAELVWTFLFDFAAKRRIFRAQVLECVAALLESKAWENAYSESAALQRKAQTLPGELPACLAAHDAILRSFPPQRIREIQRQAVPEELTQDRLRRGLAAAKHAEQLHRRLLGEAEVPDTGPGPGPGPGRDLGESVLDELQDALDAVRDRVDRVDADEAVFARLRLALLHAVVMPEALDREAASAPLVWTFLVDFTHGHPLLRRRILEVVNLLSASAPWRTAAASPVLQQRLAELPPEVRRGWAVQQPAAEAEAEAEARDVRDQLSAIRQSMALRSEPASAQEPEQPDEWREAVDARGRTYYYNRRTRASQWERPPCLALTDAAGSMAGPMAGPIACAAGAAGAAGASAGRWAVGDAVEVWSNSRQLWCAGRVEQVSSDTVSVAFRLPGEQWARKELPARAGDLRPVQAKPQNALPAGHAQQPQPYSADEQAQYAQLLRDSGAPNGQRVVAFLYRSGLPRRCLKEIWQLGNPEAKQDLEAREFYPCCRMVAHCQHRGQDALLQEGGRPLRQVLRGMLLTPPPRPPAF